LNDAVAGFDLAVWLLRK